MQKKISYDGEIESLISQQIHVKFVVLCCCGWIKNRSTQKLKVEYWFPNTLEEIKLWNFYLKKRFIAKHWKISQKAFERISLIYI
jgi:hypothetical protein